jgi:hypothetical protein
MTKFFPLVIVGLMLCASIPYWLVGDWRHGLYWTAAAIINLSVTL